MGGIDETKFQERNLPAIAREVDDALAQAGRRNFILAPGCTLVSFTPKRSLTYLRDYTRTSWLDRWCERGSALTAATPALCARLSIVRRYKADDEVWRRLSLAT